VLHQAADEVDIAGQPVELGDDDRAALIDLASGLERGGELRAAIERVGTLACLDFDNRSTMRKPASAANALMAATWASRPRPLRPCAWVDTRA
jgi:hypothetical protein